LVDSTDLIVLASVVQTVVITLTLGVFIFQFRGQERSIRESAVQNVMGRYTDFVKMLVEKPELARLRTFVEGISLPEGTTLEKLSPEEDVIYAYLLLGYGMLEEIFLLYKKKWIDDPTWAQWSAFVEKMCSHPLFARVHRVSRGTFDPEFEEYVAKMIKGAAS
jgi:hypothetical protein